MATRRVDGVFDHQNSASNFFNQAFDTAMDAAVQRFSREYILQDEDLVLAIMQDPDFWHSESTGVFAESP